MRTAPVPGSDPAPQSGERAEEDEPLARGDGPTAPDDDRLRREKPPHYG